MSRTYLIIGAQSIIAKHVIEGLLKEEHHVLAASRKPHEIAPANRLKTLFFDADPSESTLDLPDSLDGLVYFPGSITLKPITRLTEEDFLRDYRVNVLGAVRVIQQALPSLKKSPRASIVLFSSVAAQVGMGFHSSIATAKAGVEGLGRSLAAELAPKVRVNMIAPSLTDTPLAASLLSNEEQRRLAADRHPSKSIGAPEDVAALVTFLLSDRSQFMTGQVLRLDGGLSSVKLF
ncbi:MAG: 3-oxoacyl-[acyl-carrier protein] reductase [Verrucomicrobiales bacterium]|jgi:3-oxoacyl-[acyl-carrier protein] reductase